MLVVTPKQMRALDDCAISRRGIPGRELMERAGRGVAESIREQFGDLSKGKVAVVCGCGNNGGDGFVAGRYLAEWGYDVRVFIAGEVEKLRGDAEENFKRIAELGIAWVECKIAPELAEFALIVDALVGTGFRGKPAGYLRDFIRAINETDAYVVAVDIPSGVNGETGAVHDGLAVKADLTVTFGFPKLGLLLWPGRGYVNSLRVIDIGIPSSCVDEKAIRYETNDPVALSQLLPERAGDGHKGTFGKGVIISGGLSYTGAPTLVCNSFFRSGAGYCVLLCPRSLYPILSSKLTETVIRPVAEVRKKQVISLRALGELLQWAGEADSIVIGPGLGRYRETVEMVQRFVSKPGLPPLLIDGDGLYALSKCEGIFDEITAPFVITPHTGELARLLGRTTDEISAKRLEEAKDWAEHFGGVLVIKGNPTLLVSPEYPGVVLNTTGNNGMAKAGSGDVLSGLIAGFLAQGVEPFNAARLGVYIHGLAGDIAGEMVGIRSIMPTDIAEFIPEAIEVLEGRRFSPDYVF